MMHTDFNLTRREIQINEKKFFVSTWYYKLPEKYITLLI